MSLHIEKNNRELFWDCHLVDESKTTAVLTMHKPVKRELVCTLDKPWEGDSSIYFNIVKLDEGYRMYYLGITAVHNGVVKPFYACFMESKDGLNWHRPELNVCEFEGDSNNNIILKQSTDDPLDNFFVFKDENPDCLPEERFKAVSHYEREGKPFPDNRELWCYTSPDGIHFKKAWMMTDGSVPNGGIFDSLNIAYWDKRKKKYVSYVRGLHQGPGAGTAGGLRDIRYMESEDFKNWTNPVILRYGESDDCELYTNNVMPYYRAPHVVVGFPTRYTEKHRWLKNFEQMCEGNIKKRKEHFETLPRLAWALTDGLFMSSRNGLDWHRFDEAMFTPETEHTYNWIYGDCYPAYGLIETPREYPHITNEISMFMKEGHRGTDPARLYRYTIRLDGFASFHAGYEEKVIETKPFTFTGEKMELNFRTSAKGYIIVDVLDDCGRPLDGFSSYEIFGDAHDRPVLFGEGAELKNLEGKTVRLRFTMSDADVYSFVFK